jgi:hypothetical protein
VDLSGCRGIAGSELESFLGPAGADRRRVHGRFFMPHALLGKPRSAAIRGAAP